MRHRKVGKRLNRNSSHRRSMVRNMATSLIQLGRIRTTDAKAKWLRPQVERLVTLAKRGDLSSRRRVAKYVFSKEAVQKLFDDYAKRYENRNGGYTRIIKEGVRPGDNSEMSYIEFLPAEGGVESEASAE